MKTFRFRLESLLTLRASKADQAQQAYAQAQLAVARAERELSNARAELERLHELLESARVGRSKKNDQIIALNAIAYQQSVCERQAERLTHLQLEAQERLNHLLAAKRAHEVLLRLRSRHLTKHRKEAERNEHKLVDDLVISRFAARTSETTA